MHLTRRGEYALRTLIRIGVAHSFGREVIAVSELAGALLVAVTEIIRHYRRLIAYGADL